MGVVAQFPRAPPAQALADLLCVRCLLRLDAVTLALVHVYAGVRVDGADAVAAPNDEGPSALCPMPFLGGGANSPLWTQIIADATRRPLAPLPDASTVAARGCAAGAFEFLGLWGPISDNDHDFGEGGGRAKPPAGYFPRRGEGEVR